MDGPGWNAPGSALGSLRDRRLRAQRSFRRFLALLATRCGQILNRSAMAAPLGVSVPTVSQWLGALEITGQVLLVPDPLGAPA
jgi:hypothetical protein